MALLEKEWFIQAPWGRLCIIAWGDCCDPPVLVCHGTNDSAVSFRPLIKLLPRKFYYIGLELPGCGKSDPMPSGLMISLYDLVYSLQIVVKHFRWTNFVYIGHSMGCSLGKTYELSYPGKISKLIELDPVTFNVNVPPEMFAVWYNRSVTNFFDKYSKYNNDNPNHKPKYTKKEALSKVMKRRGISREIAEALLARVTETTDDGLLRFAFDERYSSVTFPPFSKEHVKLLFTSIQTPTLTIIADESKNKGKYNFCTYLLSESPSWPNYRVREVAGNHDVHIVHPERVAPFLVQFLLDGLNGLDNKAKL